MRQMIADVPNDRRRASCGNVFNSAMAELKHEAEVRRYFSADCPRFQSLKSPEYLLARRGGSAVHSDLVGLLP